MAGLIILNCCTFLLVMNELQKICFEVIFLMKTS